MSVEGLDPLALEQGGHHFDEVEVVLDERHPSDVATRRGERVVEQGFHIGHPEPISTIAGGGFGSGGGAADALLTAQPSISSIR